MRVTVVPLDALLWDAVMLPPGVEAGSGLLGPDRDLSRAEFVQMLHNLEGKPVVNYLMGFEDIHGGAWYTEAVRWAASRRIAGGYGGGRVGPPTPAFIPVSSKTGTRKTWTARWRS